MHYQNRGARTMSKTLTQAVDSERIARLEADLLAMRERCTRAERRVQRYQIAHCRLLGLVGDLCSADEWIEYEAKPKLRAT